LNRGHLFRLIRVAVTVGLLLLILRTISLYDRVSCRDGTVVVGELEELGAATVTVRLATGGVRVLSAEEVARDPETGAVVVRYGLLPVLRRVDLRVVAGVSLAFGVPYLLVALRWQLLLAAQGIRFRLVELLRLVFIGLLFNNVMPGSLGGDVVKAHYVTRRTSQKAAGVLTVFLDRVLGLLGLTTLCLLGTLTNLSDPRFRLLFLELTALLLLVVAGGAVFLSAPLRRFLHVDGILRRLPFRHTVAELDRAFLIYRDHRDAVVLGFLLSLGVHLIVVSVNWILGRSLGLEATLGQYFSLAPVALGVATLPISIAGWGVGEWAYAVLFSRLSPSNWTPAMALSVLFRVSTVVVWSMLGAVFLILGERPTHAELEQEVAEEKELLREPVQEGAAGEGDSVPLGLPAPAAQDQPRSGPGPSHHVPGDPEGPRG
jgi:uncharacterized protein (TIRG00374 family)